ncbi:MAG: hypothetical protein Q8R00_00870 [Candidatus Nanoarchaeia archaeon]|nr:hypothetical protein [Candidatus Nanoarchaeia archaeon]
MVCGKCATICGWLFLALGVVLLLKDLAIWDFWGINWWTGVIILFGLAHIGKGKCSDCQSCEMPTKKRR